MKRLIPSLLLFFSCTTGNEPQFQIVEYKKYDSPAKSQVSIRVILPDATKPQIQSIMKDLFDNARTNRFKFHKEPTHIYIYAYRDSMAISKGAWIAKQERTISDTGTLIVRLH